MNNEAAMQSDFADAVIRVIRSVNEQHSRWAAGPYRDFICGVWPKAVSSISERAVAIFMEGRGIACRLEAPPRGQKRGDLALRAGGSSWGLRAAIQAADGSFCFSPLANPPLMRYAVIGFEPQVVRVWALKDQKEASLFENEIRVEGGNQAIAGFPEIGLSGLAAEMMRVA